MSLGRSEFSTRVVIAVAIASVPFLVWYLRDFLLIVVGALLVAMLLRLVSEPFVRWARLPAGAALAASGVLILVAIGGSGYLFGTQMTSELQDVMGRADTAITAISDWMRQSQLGQMVMSHIDGGSFSVTSFAGSILKLSAGLFEGIVFTVVAGAYLAVQPALYRQGARYLFPPRWRPEVEETMDDVGRALRLWLLGQGIQMLLIGVLSTIAVWLIGLPSPLALGAIAGVAEFIPYLGPIIAAIPAVLVAMTLGFYPALWTVVAYIIIHQVEGDVIVPMIQRRLIYIPPAVLLLSIVAISEMFGSIGIVLAAPIAVIAFVGVKKLYVRDSLGQPTKLPGEPRPMGTYSSAAD